MATIDIALTYTVWVPMGVKLPDHRQWEDVKSMHVRWDTLIFCFKDGYAYTFFNKFVSCREAGKATTNDGDLCLMR